MTTSPEPPPQSEGSKPSPRAHPLQKWVLTGLFILVVCQFAWLAWQLAGASTEPRTVTGGQQQKAGGVPAGLPAKDSPPLSGGQGGGLTNMLTLNLPFLVNGLMTLEGTSDALSTAQKARILPAAARLCEGSARQSKLLVDVLLVLTESQRNLATQPVGKAQFPAPGATGTDPLLELALVDLGKLAGPSPEPVVTPAMAPHLPPELHRWPVLNGLMHLKETQDPLSPAQARAVVELLKEMKTQVKLQQEAQQEVLTALTDAQKTAIAAQWPSNSDITAARLLKAWLGQAR